MFKLLLNLEQKNVSQYLFAGFILYYIKKYPDVEMHFQTDRKWKRKYTLPPIFPRFPKFKKKRKIECSHNFPNTPRSKAFAKGQVKWLCFCGKVIPMTSVSLWRCHSLVCSSSTSYQNQVLTSDLYLSAFLSENYKKVNETFLRWYMKEFHKGNELAKTQFNIMRSGKTLKRPLTWVCLEQYRKQHPHIKSLRLP